jgi:peptidoglycan/LPS O-acetylase OafA/YrhL
MPKNPGENIFGLDALRALAIVMVLLFHLEVPVSGPLGVVIFFVLSGYLITGILLREYERNGHISLQDFYLRRAFRIFPAFYVAWMVDVLFRLIGRTPIDTWHALGSFLYLGDYVRALDPKSMQDAGPMWISWSLAIEEKFYLLWPLALLFVLRRGRDPRRALLGFILAAWAWRAFLAFGLKVSGDYLYNAFDCRTAELAVGCLAACINRPQRLPAIALLASVGFLVFSSFYDCYGWGTPGWSLVVLAAQPLAAAVLVLWLAGIRTAKFAHLAIATTARLSYSLYLYHPIVLRFFTPFFILHFPAGTKKISAVIVTLGFSLASWRFVEKPLLAIRDRKVPGGNARVRTAVSGGIA